MGTPVLSSTGARIGTLEHVLEVRDLDLFDGIVVATQHGVRFIDADRVTRITQPYPEVAALACLIIETSADAGDARTSTPQDWSKSSSAAGSLTRAMTVVIL